MQRLFASRIMPHVIRRARACAYQRMSKAGASMPMSLYGVINNGSDQRYAFTVLMKRLCVSWVGHRKPIGKPAQPSGATP